MATDIIRLAGVPYPAGATWAPTTLRRAFGSPLPSAIAAHQDGQGAVPVAIVADYLDQLGHAALSAFERHSEHVSPPH